MAILWEVPRKVWLLLYVPLLVALTIDIALIPTSYWERRVIHGIMLITSLALLTRDIILGNRIARIRQVADERLKSLGKAA